MPAPTHPVNARATRALTLASMGTLCVLTAGALGITVLGKVHRPGEILDMPIPAPSGRMSVPQAAAAPAAPPVPIDKIIMAGRAVIADPALIENSAQGPL